MISKTPILLNFCNALLRISLISALVILLLFFESVEANTKIKSGVSIIVPNSSSQYAKVVNQILNKLKLNKNTEEVTTLYLSNPALSKVSLNNKKLVVLIGSRSFDFYSKSNSKSPYLTTLITKSAFDYLYQRTKYKNNFIGGIMIDQPVKRYIDLTKALLPSLKKAGLVIGPEKIKQKNSVLKGIGNSGVDYSFVEISVNDNPVNKLRKAYELNQALIVFPDRKKFNRSLSRWILTLSYQYKVPLISYSRKYADAGALASLFSTSEKMGNQTAEMMIPFLNNASFRVNKLISPKYFDININQSVAKALNIRIPAKLEILKKIPN